jgi:hypothetical protein
MRKQIPIHLWHEALSLKAIFFENSQGCGIVRMREGLDFGEPQTPVGYLEAKIC